MSTEGSQESRHDVIRRDTLAANIREIKRGHSACNPYLYTPVSFNTETTSSVCEQHLYVHVYPYVCLFTHICPPITAPRLAVGAG